MLYETSISDKRVDLETLGYGRRYGFVDTFKREDFKDYNSLNGRVYDYNKNAGNSGQQSKRGRNTGKSGGLLSGYKGEKLKGNDGQ